MWELVRTADVDEQVAYIPGALFGGVVPRVAYRCVLVSSWFLHQMPALLWTPCRARSGVAAYPAPPCPGQGERMLWVSLDSRCAIWIPLRTKSTELILIEKPVSHGLFYFILFFYLLTSIPAWLTQITKFVSAWNKLKRSSYKDRTFLTLWPHQCQLTVVFSQSKGCANLGCSVLYRGRIEEFKRTPCVI